MAKKIEKLIYTNERGESITFSHASIFHTNEVIFTSLIKMFLTMANLSKLWYVVYLPNEGGEKP